MSKSEVDEHDYIPVDKDKLKDEQKAELERATKLMSKSASSPSAQPGLVM